MAAKPADVRFYIDADVPGLAKMLVQVRPDVTYPGDPGGVLHKRYRPCPVQSTDVDDEKSGRRHGCPGAAQQQALRRRSIDRRQNRTLTASIGLSPGSDRRDIRGQRPPRKLLDGPQDGAIAGNPSSAAAAASSES